MCKYRARSPARSGGYIRKNETTKTQKQMRKELISREIQQQNENVLHSVGYCDGTQALIHLCYFRIEQSHMSNRKLTEHLRAVIQGSSPCAMFGSYLLVPAIILRIPSFVPAYTVVDRSYCRTCNEPQSPVQCDE